MTSAADRHLYATVAPALAVVSLVFSSCIDTSTVLDVSTIENGAPATRAADAERVFDVVPRTEANAALAFEAMRDAAQATDVEAPERLPRLVLAAQYAIWVARHGSESSTRSSHADAAIVVCNTAIQDAPERVEGYYYRAIATGMYARENTIYGPDAMGQIRADARRAIQLDPEFDSAGPHRVLGGLYLEAPGPPSGVGSLRRALRELEVAVRIAPDHPDNALLLAKAYLDADRDLDRAAALLDRLPETIGTTGGDLDRALWRTQWAELRARLAER